MTSDPSAGRWKNLKEGESLGSPVRQPPSCSTRPCRSVPPQMVEEQRDVEAKCDPLSGAHEHQAEEPVDGVLRDHQLPRKDTGSPPCYKSADCQEGITPQRLPGKCCTIELHVVL